MYVLACVLALMGFTHAHEHACQTLHLVIFQVQFIFHSLFNRPINLSSIKRPKVIFKRHLHPCTYSHSKIVYYDAKISITNNVQNEFSAPPTTKKAIHFFQIKNQLPPQPLALFYQFQSPVNATTTTDHHPTSTHLTNMTKHQSNHPSLFLQYAPKFPVLVFFFSIGKSSGFNNELNSSKQNLVILSVHNNLINQKHTILFIKITISVMHEEESE